MKKQIIMIEGFDGSGKSTLSRNLAERLNVEQESFFKEYRISYDIEPLSIPQDEFIGMIDRIYVDMVAIQTELVVFDRGLITMISALPKDCWERFRYIFNDVTIIMCVADLQTTESRLIERGNGEELWYDNSFWIEKSHELIEFYQLPFINTANQTEENTLQQALEILEVPQIMYFAGSMIIDPKTDEIDLEKDYRTFLVDGDKILLPFDPIALNEKYLYGYPSFYYLDERNLASLSSSLIIEKESKIIPSVDIMVIFLQEKISAGTLGELMYAAMNKKIIHIYYIPSATESEVYNTSQWYPILMSQKINPGNISVKEVQNLEEFLKSLKEDFNINQIKELC